MSEAEAVGVAREKSQLGEEHWTAEGRGTRVGVL
jgi:hypothetical protein